jgi:uncharacterized protein YcgI (DUF1989 family)
MEVRMKQGEVMLRLNQQQIELLDGTVERLEAADREEVLKRALREYADAGGHEGASTKPARTGGSVLSMTERKLLDEIVIEPGTGKALELRRGQVLRIEQLVGAQCADFNCFNLHDYKEFMHTGRIRHLHGLNPSKGDFLWSAPPRERAMAAILEDTSGTNDALYPRCSAFLFEYHYGLVTHTNCHDIQAESQREYGLTPDDVHDSFNFFMHTGVDSGGRPFIADNVAKQGDYVELLALIDVLAVPNVCGADVMATSNFELKPLRLAVYEGTDEDLARFDGLPLMRSFTNQRTPADFKQPNIRADRELRREEGYKPQFTNVPIKITEVRVPLGEEDRRLLDRLRESGELGETDSEVFRYAFHGWWINRFMEGPKHFDPEAAQDGAPDG